MLKLFSIFTDQISNGMSIITIKITCNYVNESVIDRIQTSVQKYHTDFYSFWIVLLFDSMKTCEKNLNIFTVLMFFFPQKFKTLTKKLNISVP